MGTMENIKVWRGVSEAIKGIVGKGRAGKAIDLRN